MLTFILLVVLAGGVGLIAVSAAERTDPATPSFRSRRGRTEAHHVDDVVSQPRARTEHDALSEPGVVAGEVVDRSGPTRRTDRGSVPARLTAVEGAFDVVAVPRWSRRLVSLGFIVTLAIVLAVVIAAVIGTAAAVVGRLLDGAIG